MLSRPIRHSRRISTDNGRGDAPPVPASRGRTPSPREERCYEIRLKSMYQLVSQLLPASEE